MKSIIPLVLGLFCLQDPAPDPQAPGPAAPPPIVEPSLGLWRGWLASPGGELPFNFEIESKKVYLKATLINGAEMSRVTSLTFAPENRLIFVMHHYDAVLVGDMNAARNEMQGFWKKRTRNDQWQMLPFSAKFGENHRFSKPDGAAGPSEGKRVAGRWSVQFASDTNPSVAIFEADQQGQVTGTVLNVSGDFRYLDGDFIDNRLRLSTFDGAMALLFDARLQEDGTLRGDFWSGDSWHDTWTARRDDQAALTDTTSITRVIADPVLADLIFLDLEKQRRALDEKVFQGRARVIEIMGTWCPNCYDSAALLSDLYRKYKDRGLNVLAIAYEHSADLNRNLKQIKTFAGRVGVEYPILIGGSSDIANASKTLPFIDRIHAFPTTIFLDHEGQVRLIDTGFVGPAAGPDHDALRKRYELLIEELLAAAPPVVDSPSAGTEVEKP